MGRKIIKIIVEDIPPCEFEDAEDLRRYNETHQEELTEQLSWSEAVKRFKHTKT